jgi:hypothetical protein
MTRAAVITDIHGNVPALEAALRRIDELGVGDVYCGGDLVGYGPRPNEICRTLEERGTATVYGNYDYAIARDLDDCGCFYPTPKDREIGQGSVALGFFERERKGLQAHPPRRAGRGVDAGR